MSTVELRIRAVEHAHRQHCAWALPNSEVLIIGTVVGLFFNRYARTCLSRLRNTTHTDVTSALVRIAGAFLGFYLAVILGLLPTPLTLYLAAIVGAFIVLWAPLAT